MASFTYEGMFWIMLFLGPYIMTYAWSMSFWIRLWCGFFALSQGISQLLYEPLIPMSPYRPFGGGSQTYIAICMATACTGALLGSFAEPVGILFLKLWGTYTVYTFLLVAWESYGVNYDEKTGTNRSETWLYAVFGTVFFLFLLGFLFRGCCKVPKRARQFMAAVTGAAFGAYTTTEAIYFSWDGPKVFGLLASNRRQWCFQPTCKVFSLFFWVLCLVSLITQYFVFRGEKRWPREKFAPVPFRHPNDPDAAEQKGVTKSNSWSRNLATPARSWFFLTCVVCGTCAFNYLFSFLVKWQSPSNTSFFVGTIYILVNAFLLWSLVEFFCLTLCFHVVRLVCDLPPLPHRDFSRGLPQSGRTILAYCLLSKHQDSSRETFDTALQAHLANLDPNGRISTAVVSVSSLLSVVQCEMDARDRGRAEIRRVLLGELDAVMRFAEVRGLVQSGGRASAVRAITRELQALPNSSGAVRAQFWLGVLEAERLQGVFRGPELLKALKDRVEECAQHYLYLHRTCKILKKPGQYQDLIVLGSTGNNRAYTYLKADYGDLGREEDSVCFGFSGNMQEDAPSKEGGAGAGFEEAVASLEVRGAEDVERVVALGRDPKNRYFYTMVLDSDTACPPDSIRQLVEVAEHGSNAHYGIVNANLANDYGSDEGCTWHMWRNALIEVSTVNLQRGQFWVFGRTGFYGKGLVRNGMYIERIIGEPGNLIEALPVDILSHDTVEAKLLQPGIAHSVTLYEDVARNPISGLAQSTRWMLGEVRNSLYEDGFYTFFVHAASNAYSLVTKRKLREQPFVRWTDVPCSVGAEYLSHMGFRMFHAGPAILVISLCSSVFAQNQLLLQLTQVSWLNPLEILIVVLIILFFLPKAFLILDKLPTCGLGRRRHHDVEHKADRAQTVEDGPNGEIEDESEGSSTSDEEVSETTVAEKRSGRCGILMRQLALALIEVLLSLLLFAPELIVGVIRLCKGVWAQVTGRQSWVPQDVVEKEVERDLSVWYVFQKTWIVFACGVVYGIYLAVMGLFTIENWLLMGTLFTWVVYPFTTYVACLPVSSRVRESWLWTWVMDIKHSKDTSMREVAAEMTETPSPCPDAQLSLS